MRTKVILALLNPEEASGAFWNLTSMSLGLMIAACVAVAQDGLSFFNANLVQNLVWWEHSLYSSSMTLTEFIGERLANIAQWFVLGPTGQLSAILRNRGETLGLVFLSEYILSCALTLCLWSVCVLSVYLS